MSYREKIIDYLKVIGVSGSVANPEKKSNTGKVLAEIFAWQEAEDYASKQLKKAWKDAQESGAVTSDDVMRAAGEGEHIFAEGGRFSCVGKVVAPGVRFDKDTFIAEVARKYKIKDIELQKLAVKCCNETKPALTKRVLEA